MRVITDLWSHQQKALEFTRNHKSCALFMDMRTGKTLTSLKWIEENNFKKVLVVCPARIMPVWEEEIDTHTCNVRTILLNKGTSRSKALFLNELKNIVSNLYDQTLIVVINYDSVYIKDLGKAVRAFGFDAIIADEIHRIKSHSSKVSKFMGRLGKEIEHKLGLTGTPFPNNKLDIFGQYRFLDPGIFGTRWTHFKFEYAIWGGFNNYQLVGWKNENDFNERVDSIAFRIKADDVLDLPEAIDIIRTIDLDPKKLKVYREFEKEFIATYNNEDITADIVLVKLLRLHQMSGGFIQLDNGDLDEFHTKKINLLFDVFDEIGYDKDIVVFFRFRPEMDKVYTRLFEEGNIEDDTERKGSFVYELHGDKNQLDDWKAFGGILLVQIDSGAEGIDLSRSKYSIFYSTGYSYGKYSQARARIRGPKSKEESVAYIHLITNKTVDRDIFEAIKNKENISESVLNNMKNRIK